MAYDPNIHHRKSIRLKGYDYSQSGLYFITICSQDREYIFGEIINSEMKLNNIGEIAAKEWLKLKSRFPNIEIHEYVIMPNHFHAILEITPVGATLVVAQNNVGAQNNVVAQNTVEIQKEQPIIDENANSDGQPQEIAPTENETNKTIGELVGAFKSIVTVQYINGVKTLGWKPFQGKIWQRNYYEIIIHDEKSYQNISNYIINNPSNWQEDIFYKKQ